MASGALPHETPVARGGAQIGHTGAPRRPLHTSGSDAHARRLASGIGPSAMRLTPPVRIAFRTTAAVTPKAGRLEAGSRHVALHPYSLAPVLNSLFPPPSRRTRSVGRQRLHIYH